MQYGDSPVERREVSERRDSQMLGRRKTDHADGQVQWLEQHFMTYIERGFGKIQIDLANTVEMLLDKALGGKIPERVAALEKHNQFRELRTVLTSVVASVAASVCVVFVGRLLGWWA